eukprot:TRINITY_DN21796_c0_g1_i1.p1 TRINITY_DN21796_c0_g1~~TRINITY_DN21796_c0_g1_i1.p1  ORF type:complete len:248 (-),score=54.00 TRINITY_DN21796_c0_g1_i1:635-1378(-)
MVQLEVDSVGLAFALTTTLSIITMVTVLSLRKLKVLSTLASRKILHIATGPAFCFAWSLFPSSAPESRIVAALVPAGLTTVFVAVGYSLIKFTALVETVSRGGTPLELLVGPLYYGIVHVLATLIYWKNSPTGVIGLLIVCAGDGCADLVGRSLGKYFENQIPWSRSKTWMGSAAFVGFSVFTCGLFVPILQMWGVQEAYSPLFLFQVAAIAFFAAFVETLPFDDIDNITVFMSCAVGGAVFWGFRM